MRTTVTLDDDLVADAATYSGVDDKSKLINLALDYYVKRMAAKRLVALGGTMPDLVVPARNAGRTGDDSPSKEAARALAALGGTMPDLEDPVRRKSTPFPGGEPLSKVAEDPAPYRTKKKSPGDAEA
jgi:Arc/MetJ family transcription regulator